MRMDFSILIHDCVIPMRYVRGFLSCTYVHVISHFLFWDYFQQKLAAFLVIFHTHVHACTYIYMCTLTRTHTHTHTHARTHARTHMHARTRTRTHTHTHTHTHAHTHTHRWKGRLAFNFKELVFHNLQRS